jgi:hypothetical protein
MLIFKLMTLKLSRAHKEDSHLILQQFKTKNIYRKNSRSLQKNCLKEFKDRKSIFIIIKILKIL